MSLQNDEPLIIPPNIQVVLPTDLGIRKLISDINVDLLRTGKILDVLPTVCSDLICKP